MRMTYWVGLGVVIGSMGCEATGAPDTGALVRDAGPAGDAGSVLVGADAGPLGADAGTVDAGAPTDGGPCPPCGGDTPLCDIERGACVGCLDASHCPAERPFCDPSQRCVACQDDGACTDPAAPSCTAGDCGGCASDASCQGFPSRPLCDPASGGCVECLGDAECDDGDPCTTDTCGAGGTCVSAPYAECVVDLSVGGGHVCVVRGTGAIDCWGRNTEGQLGDGTLESRLAPTRVPGIVDAVDVEAGPRQTCATTRGGDILCWGAADAGLGFPTTAGQFVTVPMSLGQTGAAQVSAGFQHSCAAYGDGSMRCWGSGPTGALGRGSTTSSVTPSSPLFITSMVAEARVGGGRSCARFTTGVLFCWGWGANGAVGDGMEVDRFVPTQVLPLRDVIDIDMDIATCAVERGGATYCWGQNAYGRLGDGTTTSRSLPARVVGLDPATRVTTTNGHSCALEVGGQVACWGRGLSGALGNGLPYTNVLTAVDVAGLDDAVLLDAGGATTCALRTSGELVCWGHNGYGQIGDGTITHRDRPTPVLGL